MTTLTLRDSGVTDTQLSKNTPTAQFGTTPSFYVGAATLAKIDRVVIKFAGLAPPGGVVTVSSAVLTLKNADAAASTRVMEVRRLLSAWDEAQATYNNRLTGTAWNVAGVLGGTDVDATVIATGTMPTGAGTFFNVSGAGFTQYVQDVMNGVITDYGVLLSVIDDTTVFDAIDRRVGARDNTTATNRPTLVVTYTLSTPPSVTISDVTVNNLSGTATVVVSLSDGAPPGGVTVNYATQDDTATAPAYYTGTSGTLTFAEGETTKNVTVSIVP